MVRLWLDFNQRAVSHARHTKGAYGILITTLREAVWQAEDCGGHVAFFEGESETVPLLLGFWERRIRSIFLPDGRAPNRTKSCLFFYKTKTARGACLRGARLRNEGGSRCLRRNASAAGGVSGGRRPTESWL